MVWFRESSPWLGGFPLKKTLFALLLVVMLVGCNKPLEKFDDKLIEIQLINTQKLISEYVYTLKIKNNGSFVIKHAVLYLSFPIKTENGTKSNPFKIEAKANDNRNHYLIKPVDEVYYTVYAPIDEVFTDTSLIDIENPTIEFKGFHLNGKEEIPFGIIRGI
jgi:hypothetical protein